MPGVKSLKSPVRRHFSKISLPATIPNRTSVPCLSLSCSWPLQCHFLHSWSLCQRRLLSWTILKRSFWKSLYPVLRKESTSVPLQTRHLQCVHCVRKGRFRVHYFVRFFSLPAAGQPQRIPDALDWGALKWPVSWELEFFFNESSGFCSNLSFEMTSLPSSRETSGGCQQWQV